MAVSTPSAVRSEALRRRHLLKAVLPVRELALTLALTLALAAAPLRASHDVSRVEQALDRGDLAAAVEAGEALVKAAPESSESWYWAGRAYGEKARHATIFTQLSWAKKCRLAFEKSVALDPRSLDARLALFQYHVYAPRIVGGGLEKAEQDAGVLATLDAARGHWAQALLARKRKDRVRAERELRAAIEADPRWPGARASLVDLYLEADRLPEARTTCEHALAEAPGDTRLTSLLTRITEAQTAHR